MCSASLMRSMSSEVSIDEEMFNLSIIWTRKVRNSKVVAAVTCKRVSISDWMYRDACASLKNFLMNDCSASVSCLTFLEKTVSSSIRTRFGEGRTFNWASTVKIFARSVAFSANASLWTSSRVSRRVVILPISSFF